MTSEHRPLPADLLILKRSHSSMLFLVGTDYDHPQLSCKTYQEALRHATGTAKRTHVDVWSTDDGASFERVAQFRH